MKQEQRVMLSLFDKQAKNIQQVEQTTQIKRPNIRRILGQGTHTGKFQRLGRGIYRLSDKGREKLLIYTADAREKLPELAEQGLKADMIFLDIPYNTPAIKGGNRGIRYNTIEPFEFFRIVKCLRRICRTEDTPIVYMYSRAKSGRKKMQEYTQALFTAGFSPIAYGNYFKYQQDGHTRVRNMRGDIIEPEGIIVLNQSGRPIELQETDFHCIRPKGYQTEKSELMLMSLIKQTTQPQNTILDPFAGSGSCLSSAVRLDRQAIGIEINPQTVEHYILKRNYVTNSRI